MGTFRDDLLADIDDIRGIPGEFGLHRFQVYVRVTTYAGSRVGDGAATVTETRLLVGGQNPHVREVRSKDVVAGDNAAVMQEYEIGPVTANAADDTDAIDPPRVGTTPATTLYRIVGPGCPPTGLLCQKYDDGTARPFRYMIRVKSTGRAAPT
jgi:hypothetical protein